MVKEQKGLPVWMIASFVGLIGLSYLLGSKFNCNGVDGNTTGSDTVFYPKPIYVVRDSFIHDTVEKYIEVNPHPQIDFEKPASEDTTYGGYVIKTDSDTITLTLTKTPKDSSKTKPIFEYSDKFLKAFPDRPKLISSKISKKLVTYSFLLPNGYPRVSTYPVDLDNYLYTWENGIMKAEPLSKPRGAKFPKIYFESYTSLTYNPFRNSSRLAIDGTINWGKFGITSFMAFSTNTAPSFDAGIGTRFKIK